MITYEEIQRLYQEIDKLMTENHLFMVYTLHYINFPPMSLN